MYGTTIRTTKWGRTITSVVVGRILVKVHFQARARTYARNPYGFNVRASGVYDGHPVRWSGYFNVLSVKEALGRAQAKWEREWSSR